MSLLAEDPDAPAWKKIVGNVDKLDAGRHKLRDALIAFSAFQATYEMTKRTYRNARKTLSYAVTVPNNDDIYPLLHEWLVAQLPERRLRSMTAGMQRKAIPSDWDDNIGGYKAKLQLYYDGRSEVTVDLEGHRVRVALERDHVEPWMNKDERRGKMSNERIVFTAFGINARNAVVALLESLVEEQNRTSKEPRFMLASRWGDWSRRQDLQSRTIDSVVLRPGQKEEIVDDLDQFLKDEDAYNRLGIPYHRGYLFHGPPGTGKSSFAKALASHFGLDVYYVPLSDLEQDASLLQLLSAVAPRSLVLFEDIDILHAAKERDDEGVFGVTLSGLLNALDGVGTPNGLITVLTTNNISVLDSALIRPGRVDRVEEIGYVTDDQLDQLVETYLGERAGMPALNGTEIAPAEIIEVFKRHLHDDNPTIANAVRLLIHQKVAA